MIINPRIQDAEEFEQLDEYRNHYHQLHYLVQRNQLKQQQYHHQYLVHHH
jgi:hypothetical protein